MALNQQPNSLTAYFYFVRAKINLHTKYFYAAILDANLVNQLGNYLEIYPIIIEAKNKLGDFNGAILAADQAIALKQDLCFCYHQKAFAKLKLKDFDGAIADISMNMGDKDVSVVKLINYYPKLNEQKVI